MNKKSKSFLIFFGIACIIACLYLLYRLTPNTIYNKEFVLGNTAGNLYNGGLFCRQKDTIYFSNLNDDGALYSMNMQFSEVKKIHNDKVCYLNADENYIYYSRQNWLKKSEFESVFLFYISGLYRITKDGKSSTLLSSKPTGCSLLAGNTLYYQDYDKNQGLFLYKVNIDGTDQKLLRTENILPACVRDHTLYFATGAGSPNHYIYTMDLTTEEVSPFYTGNCYLPIATEHGIYYISLSDGHTICRISYDGTEPETLVNEFCSTYNVSEDGTMLYYQIDGGSKNRIACMNLSTGTQTTILEGNYKNIHIIDNYVFFRDFNETTTYLLNSYSGVLNTFLAPVLEK